jgi:hypothetical protein
LQNNGQGGAKGGGVTTSNDDIFKELEEYVQEKK